MKILYLIGAFVVFQIGVWAFMPEPPPKVDKPSTVAFGPNEAIYVEGRIDQRRSAIATLERPSGSRCTPEGHKSFLSGLGEYYYQRQNTIERHTETYGKLGANYIAQQWSTTDDRRIDRLTQEALSGGYFKPDELNAVARKAVILVVNGERVTSKGCSG